MLLPTVKDAFQSKHIPIQENFLQQVLIWIEETFPNASDDEVFCKIFEEWLNLDFHDAPTNVLPPNISEAINTTINDVIYLQLQNVVDISKPKYLQLKSIRNRFDDHTEDVESCGMLKLELTDGSQEVAAIEYKKVPHLSLNLQPGLKVKFIPPINVRRGQIMLEPDKIEIIGGCVPEIEVANCVENVLAAALKQPLNNNPGNKFIAPTTIPEVSDSQRTSVTLTNVTNNTVNPGNDWHPPMPSELNEIDEFDEICNEDFFNRHFEEHNIIPSQPMMTEPVPQRGNQPAPQPSNPPSQDFTDLEDEILALREEEEMMEYTAVTSTASVSSAAAAVPINRPSQTRKKNISVDAIFSPASQPVTTIQELNERKEKGTKGIFKIKMEILEVRQKFQTENNEFSMKVIAGDDTGEIEVKLNHKVMMGLIQVTPEDLREIWNDQFKLKSIMDNFTEAVNNFYAHVTLVLDNNAEPIVTDVLETFQLP